MFEKMRSGEEVSLSEDVRLKHRGYFLISLFLRGRSLSATACEDEGNGINPSLLGPTVTAREGRDKYRKKARVRVSDLMLTSSVRS